MITSVQRSLIENLKNGARLEARITKAGRLGDFYLLDKKGAVLDVVTRATLIAACHKFGARYLPKPGAKPKLPSCRCLRCGWTWIPRNIPRPKLCAGCLAPDWDVSGRPPRRHPGPAKKAKAGK